MKALIGSAVATIVLMWVAYFIGLESFAGRIALALSLFAFLVTVYVCPALLINKMSDEQRS